MLAACEEMLRDEEAQRGAPIAWCTLTGKTSPTERQRMVERLGTGSVQVGSGWADRGRSYVQARIGAQLNGI